MRRILVVGPSWIGDTLLAQPLFALLHARHDALALDVLAPHWTLPLIARMREVRRGMLNPFGHGELQFAKRRRLGHELRGEGYDQAIVLPNTFKSALVPWFAGIRLRTGYLGEMRWGLINDLRRLDERALPQLAQRYAALALAPGEPLPPLPSWNSRRAPPSRRCVPAPSMDRPSAGLPGTLPSSRACWPGVVARCG
jgi:heptosyltransferase-2